MHTPTRSLRLLALWAFAIALTLEASSATLPVGFSEQYIGTGWNEPVGLAFDPSPQRADRVYVWERTGKVWIVENGIKLGAPLIDLSEEVGGWRDYGLLGFALHPKFSQNGYIYLFYVVDRHHLLNAGTPGYSATTNEYFAATIGRITRYTARASDGFRSVDPGSRFVLVGESKSSGLPVLHQSHGVGHLVFGTDGTLMASCGDGASYDIMDDGEGDGNSYSAQGLVDEIIRAKEDVGAFRAQLVDALNGKIIRIDPNTGDGIPSNPFYDAAEPRAARSRVWTLGLRNPYRMTLRPGTGSHNPADADPGVLVVGDVGWGAWEEIHVVTGPGQNCGWPLFEGLTNSTTYEASPALNFDAPNPLGGFFRFKDLIVQETLATPSWPNPLKPSQQVPSSIRKFMHKRPVIDTGRNPTGPARTGTFNGSTAAQVLIGAADSPVAGAQFAANASTGGVFYNGTDFPALYAGTYFHADYGQRWIKNIVFDANHRPTLVREFATGGSFVFVATHPSSGGLYYADLAENAVRRIVHGTDGNRPPIAAASVATAWGASPLTVQFSSAGSSDPDGENLSYEWTFGDGTTSTQANPAKTFTATGVRRFEVTLRVTDSAGASAQTNVYVFVNHAPPGVELLGPVAGTKYTLTGDSIYLLTRRVAEQPGHPTTTQWQVFLHHNEHAHAEPPVFANETAAIISPTYSPDDSYSYRVVLKVTDDLGLSVQREAQLFPNATNVSPQLSWSIASQTRPVGAGAQIIDPLATATDADSAGIEFGELRVQATNGVFSIVPQGDATGQVNIRGNSVTVGGVVIGGVSTAPGSLMVTFDPTATPAAAQAILRRIAANFTTPGSRLLTAVFTDGDGGISQTATMTVTSGGSGPPPAPWQSQDIGAVGRAGGAAYSNGIFTLQASGSDIYWSADEFHYVAQPWVGDGTIIARVDSITQTNEWALGGVMFRESLAANSRNVLMDLHCAMGHGFQWRESTAGPTEWIDGPDYAPPRWVKLQRTGNRFTGSMSGDGITWTVVGVRDFPMASACYLGLASCASNNGALTTVVFSNVSVIGAPVNAAPTVTLTAPANGSSFTAPASIGIAANASDSDGSVAKVEFFNGTTKLGEDLTAPFTITWTNVAAGAYAIIVRATDNLGATAESAVSNITVNAPPNQPPTVALTTPLNGATFVAPASITLSANASDSDGTVARVEFYNGAAKLGEDTTAPFVFTWANVPFGTYALTARAIDNASASSISAPVSVTVNVPPNQPPLVSLTAPGHGATFTAPATVALTASATDVDGAVAKVEFYSGATKLGEDLSAPFAFSWANVAAGTYSLTARAIDNGGASTTSEASAITVNAPTNQPSLVSLTSPASGSTFTAPASITFTANASDADGSVAKVEFFSNATKLGEDGSAPFAFMWSAVAAGSYTLTARAIDNAGATAGSAGVNITVNAASSLPPGWIQQDIGGVTVAGSSSHTGGVFTVAGSGAAISGSADSFHFAAQTWSGNGEMIARLISLDGGSAGAVAGVMFRDGNAAGARHAFLEVSASQGSALLVRTAVGGNTTTVAGPAIVAPRWLRLVRTGSSLTGYLSLDGVQWQQVGTTSVNMNASIQAGLAVCATQNGALATAVFDNFVLRALPEPQPPMVAITAPANQASFTAPANITVDVSANDPDGTVARVEFYSGTTKLGEDTSAPFSLAWNNVTAGSYSLTARATDNDGNSTASAPVAIAVNSLPGALPVPWQQQDIGAVGRLGNGTYSAGTFTVQGAGIDIYWQADAFRYVWQPWTGDGTITAKVASVAHSNAWALGGVMFRESLAANSRNVLMDVTAGMGIGFQWRDTMNGWSDWVDGPDLPAPRWVRLVRRGNQFTGYFSAVGVAWTQAGTREIALPSSIYVGLAACASNPTQTTTAIFDQVTITSP